MIVYIVTAIVLSLGITFFILYKKIDKVKNFIDPNIDKLKKVNWKPIVEKAKEYDLLTKAKNFVSFFLNKKK